MGVKCNESEWVEEMRGLIILDIKVQHPSFFRRGFVKFSLKDPKTGNEYTNKLHVG